jgi:hypothetical protein
MNVKQSRIWKDSFVAYFERLFWHTPVENEGRGRSVFRYQLQYQTILVLVLYFRLFCQQSHSVQRWCARSVESFLLCTVCILFRYNALINGLCLSGPLWLHTAPHSFNATSDTARPCGSDCPICHHSTTELWIVYDQWCFWKQETLDSQQIRWMEVKWVIKVWAYLLQGVCNVMRLTDGGFIQNFFNISSPLKYKCYIHVSYGCLTLFTKGMDREKVRTTPPAWTFKNSVFLPSRILSCVCLVWLLQ